MMRLRNRERGQSMTEFVVSAAFVSVPLFIIVPTMGKFIDMKLAAVQAARYASWEYTAHYVDLKDQPIGFDAISKSQLPLKSLATTEKEAKRRFYSDTSIAIDTQRDGRGYLEADRNLLWTYHNGLPMYDEANQGGAIEVNGSDPTPDKLKVLNVLVGVVGWVTNLFAQLNAKMGLDAGFNAINPDGNATVDGMYRTQVSMKVEPAPSGGYGLDGVVSPLFGMPLDLQMEAKSGLLTETWGAGGAAHTVYQATGLVPTTYIDHILNGWGIPLQTIASTILLSPELDKSSLKFGYPYQDPQVMDMVPVDKLTPEDRTLSCDGTYCVD